MDQHLRTQMHAAKKDTKLGLVLCAIFVLIFLGASSIKTLASDGVISSRSVPQAVSVIGMALSLALTLVNAAKVHKLKKEIAAQGEEERSQEERPQEGSDAQKDRWGMMAVSVVLIAIYVYLIGILGFILSSILYLFAQIMILEQHRTVKRVLMIAAIAVGIPLLIYLPFRYIFLLILPTGIFG